MISAYIQLEISGNFSHVTFFSTVKEFCENTNIVSSMEVPMEGFSIVFPAP